MSGIELLDRSVWFRWNCRGCFVDGDIEMSLPLLDGNSHGGDGRTVKCKRAIYISRCDLDRLVATLPLPPLLSGTKLRYPDDVPLIQRAVRARKKGEATSDRQAADLVCGPHDTTQINRVRKAVSAELKEIDNNRPNNAKD